MLLVAFTLVNSRITQRGRNAKKSPNCEIEGALFVTKIIS